MKSKDIERNGLIPPRYSNNKNKNNNNNSSSSSSNLAINSMSSHCLQLISYGTPPPSWPRRLLCDNCPSLCCWSSLRDTRACRLIFLLVVVTYFVCMDIVLYRHFIKADLVKGSKAGDPSELYTPFTHLSVKALISDQPSQFLKTPSAEYFNRITGFSSTFAFISPNMISTFHLICAFVSGKFMASSVLNDRRIGVAIFCFRSWLDALDGVVFRAQTGRHLQFRSNPSTLGYYIDAIFDIAGGFFLCFGVLYYLMKRFNTSKKNFTGLTLPLLNVSSPGSKKASLLSGSSSSNGNSTNHHKHGKIASSCSSSVKLLEPSTETGGEEFYKVSYLFWKTLTLGLCMAISGFCWNSSMQEFTHVFQTELKDEKLSTIQFEYSHSLPTILVFSIWRLIGSMAILNYLLAAIFFDKIWELMQGPQLVLLCLNIVMYGITYLYIRDIKSALQL